MTDFTELLYKNGGGKLQQKWKNKKINKIKHS